MKFNSLPLKNDGWHWKTNYFPFGAPVSFQGTIFVTLPKTNSSPLKMGRFTQKEAGLSPFATNFQGFTRC